MKKFIKKNHKFILGYIFGIITLGSVVYATIINSSDIVYDNTNSGITSTNMQGAIDELYEKSQNCSGSSSGSNILDAYKYNYSNCITGEESTCVATTCYKDKTAGSCSTGTIIRYKVSDCEEKYFHVIRDEGEKMLMQQRENTIPNVAWYSYSGDNSRGPITVLPILENATSTWTNVNDLTYTAGTTTLYENAYTGCASSDGTLLCNTNTYTLEQRTAKARMITGQEAAALGCRNGRNNSCPKWMNNYLYNSTSYGGTVDVNNTYGYWTMSAFSYTSDSTFIIGYYGYNGYSSSNGINYGARAVVEINK